MQREMTKEIFVINCVLVSWSHNGNVEILLSYPNVTLGSIQTVDFHQVSDSLQNRVPLR